MASAKFYRAEAERIRALAAASPGAVPEHLLRLAAEYDQLAEALADVPGSPAQAMKAQPQVMQQQQTKAEPEKG